MVIKHVRGTPGAALAPNTEEVNEVPDDMEEAKINSTSQRNSYMRFCRRMAAKKAKDQYPQLVVEFADPKNVHLCSWIGSRGARIWPMLH